ncbi:MAG: zinc-dependent metalloprotease [Dehalococcoidia bacterium]|nr:zinc-dependent metalloprotease [Dehalococcoidia bacterium]
MINWDVVRATARRTTGVNWLDVGDDLARLTAFYADATARSKAMIAEFTGWTLPPAPEPVAVIDREGWVDLNISQFADLFRPLETRIAERLAREPLWSRLSTRGVALVIAVQLGALMGFLSRRVLGQYDVAFFGQPADRAIYYVEPNIAAVAARLGVDSPSFRLYLALHETTHAAEFGAHPWLADYLRGLISAYLDTLSDDVWGLLGVGGKTTERGDSAPKRARFVESLMTPEQRAIFWRLQAAMSLIEGYGDYVMHALAPRCLANAAVIDAKFAARRRRRSPIDRLIFRVTGLDMKLAQYELGERFAIRVVERVGRDGLDRAWRDPDSLPTMDEIRDPDAWIARVVDAPAPTEAAG